MAEIPTQAKDTSFSIQYMLVNSTMQMNDFKVQRKYYEYFTKFKFATQLIMPHMRWQNKQKMQADIKRFSQLEELIEADKELNASSKEQQLNKLRYTFADTREFYVMDCLPKVGLGIDLEEGMIDFEKTDIDALAGAVRNVGMGLSKSVEPMVKP